MSQNLGETSIWDGSRSWERPLSNPFPLALWKGRQVGLNEQNTQQQKHGHLGYQQKRRRRLPETPFEENLQHQREEDAMVVGIAGVDSHPLFLKPYGWTLPPETTYAHTSSGPSNRHAAHELG